jgi:hypothetical protein
VTPTAGFDLRTRASELLEAADQQHIRRGATRGHTGTLLFLRNRDEPEVIGQVGSMPGKNGVNIATFALGRREAARGAEAVSLVRLDGQVSASILEPIRGITAITEAKLLRLDKA